MRALPNEKPGPPEALLLREIPDFVPGEGEVRIRVEACGINYPDHSQAIELSRGRFADVLVL